MTADDRGLPCPVLRCSGRGCLGRDRRRGLTTVLEGGLWDTSVEGVDGDVRRRRQPSTVSVNHLSEEKKPPSGDPGPTFSATVPPGGTSTCVVRLPGPIDLGDDVVGTGLDGVLENFPSLQAPCFLSVDEDLVAAEGVFVEALRASDDDLP